jgi:hypothetical protein
MRESTPSRPGYTGVAADDFHEVGERNLVVGIHWIRDDGGRGEPFVYQHVKLGDHSIAHIQDYPDEQRALRAARKG